MSSLALQIPLPERFKNNQGLPDETKQEYSRILALYSSDTLDAAEWRISLCLDRKCSPQFERCFHCDLFIPDPQYKEYITTAIKRLQEANELIAKKHGSDAVRQQNLKDIQTFNAYLEKMDAPKDHQKES